MRSCVWVVSEGTACICPREERSLELAAGPIAGARVRAGRHRINGLELFRGGRTHVVLCRVPELEQVLETSARPAKPAKPGARKSPQSSCGGEVRGRRGILTEMRCTRVFRGLADDRSVDHRLPTPDFIQTGQNDQPLPAPGCWATSRDGIAHFKLDLELPGAPAIPAPSPHSLPPDARSAPPLT
jgi:hypothetical protein